MATYTNGSASAGPPDFLVDLVNDLLSSEFVHEAIRRALLAKVMEAAPSTPTDEPGVSHLAADITLTTRSLPQSGAATDDDMTLHDVCQEFTLQVLGHLVASWTVCQSQVTTTDAPATSSVRLVLSPPTMPAGGTSPATSVPWLTALTQAVLSAHFVQSAVLGALLDAVMRAVPEQPTDEPGASSLAAGITLTTQPMSAGGSAATDSSRDDCQEHFLTVGGVQLYHWTVCTHVIDVGTTPPPPPTIHLEARHPRHFH
jgi:hypothetical protein